MKSVFTFAVLSLTATGALADNFAGSCDTNSIKFIGRTLTANCKNILGQLKCSKLDVNNCLKNNYGNLQADPTGAGPHLGDQCILCSNSAQGSGVITPASPTLIHCQCNPGTGASQYWPTAEFDINTIVDNDNGVLECYNTKGTDC